MRTLLIALLAAGGVGVLAWPFVAIPSVMSAAAPGFRLFSWSGLLLALLFAYPVLWIAAAWMGWSAWRSGAALAPAAALAAIPAVAAAGFGLWLFSAQQAASGRRSASEEAERARIQPANPILWMILGLDTADSAARTRELVSAVGGASSETLNKSVPPYGTPLREALLRLPLDRNGEWISQPPELETAHRRLREAARLMIERNASLGDGADELYLVWRRDRIAKHADFEAASTAAENPLVWELVNQRPVTAWLKPELVNLPATLYGSPLRAALLMDIRDRTEELVQAGARLTPVELAEPATAKAWAEFQKRRDR
jgi:hypothetical protein